MKASSAARFSVIVMSSKDPVQLSVGIPVRFDMIGSTRSGRAEFAFTPTNWNTTEVIITMLSGGGGIDSNRNDSLKIEVSAPQNGAALQEDR